METQALTGAKPEAVSSSEGDVQETPVPERECDAHAQEHPNKYNNINDIPSSRLRRFPLRSLFLITIPPLVTVYFIIFQTVLISPDPDAAPYGRRNATWVFYSWFLLGVFGLGASTYMLQGAEAAMMQRPFWTPRNALVLSMHANGSWTGLGGWIEVVKAMAKSGTRNPGMFIGRLWVVLALVNLVIYIALPLSGLAMELSDGYVTASGHPLVIGRTPEDFHAREQNQEYTRAQAAWIGGAPMTLPGASIIYSSPGTDRAESEPLQSLPNSLPLEDGLVDVFFAPQAVNPVRGSAWGIRLGYTCDTVSSVSNLTILSQRSSDLYQYSPSGKFVNTTVGPWLEYDYSNNTFLTPDNQTITFWNSGQSLFAENTWAYGEMGQTSALNPSVGRPSVLEWRNDSTIDEESLRENGNVIEIAMWQIRTPASYETDHEFNETIEPFIAGMGSPFFLDNDNLFALNDSFLPKNLHLDIPKYNLSAITDATNGSLRIFPDNIVSISPPMGIRCVYQYAPGYADLNPESATFESFTASPAPSMGSSVSATPPFGVTASRIMHQMYYDMFTANNGAPPIIISNSRFYTSFLQPQVLLGSVMRAFGMDILQLMYDGGNSFSGAYEDRNLTATRPGKIIGPGDVPPTLVTVLLCIWAASCIAMGLVYGFRRRWAETVDGFSMLLLGANLAEEIRNQDVTMHERSGRFEKLARIPVKSGDNNKKIVA
ncbi:hypothetical protein FQN54_007010 [Arachnomyces sp. PD_36]|nr:hypothetical protein FQN54_007010 [Arachnomyces sp. PD_36]